MVKKLYAIGNKKDGIRYIKAKTRKEAIKCFRKIEKSRPSYISKLPRGARSPLTIDADKC